MTPHFAIGMWGTAQPKHKVIMQLHLLALPLPSSIRLRLATFCYGLPHVRWVEEENFHLVLRDLGPLSDSSVREIRECLGQLFFSPFSLILQGIGHFHSKGNRGILWVGVKTNHSLLSLRKQIDKHLRGVVLPSEDRPFHPHVTLGSYEGVNLQRLGEYLAIHADYRSEPLEVTHCSLLQMQQTSKHLFYQVIDQYAASSPTLGED